MGHEVVGVPAAHVEVGHAVIGLGVATAGLHMATMDDVVGAVTQGENEGFRVTLPSTPTDQLNTVDPALNPYAAGTSARSRIVDVDSGLSPNSLIVKLSDPL